MRGAGPRRRRASRCAVFLATIAVSGPAPALQWYTVEVLAFSRDGGISGEHWPSDPGTPELSDSIEPGGGLDLAAGSSPGAAAGGEPGASAPYAFRLLPASELTLHGARRRLERNGGYRRLLHIGWRQPGFEPGEARRLHVGGEGAVGASGAQTESIEGTVRVWRERYLHVEVDLLYRIPILDRSPPGSAAAPQLARFRMKARRRMRSGELHHLDHPAFGVLVLIVPYEAPQSPEAPAGPGGAAPAAVNPEGAAVPPGSPPAPGAPAPLAPAATTGRP